MIQTKKKLPPAEKLRIALNWQAETRQRWEKWRDDGKEPSVKETREIFSSALPRYDVREDFQENLVSNVKRDPSGRLDTCTSFIVWDMIENGSQIAGYVFECTERTTTLLEQAKAIVKERYDDPLLVFGSFGARLYREAKEYVSSTHFPVKWSPT